VHVEKWCGKEVLESDEEWKCFACDEKLLSGLRGQLSQSGTPSKKGKPPGRSATSTPVSEADPLDFEEDEIAFGDQEQQVLVDRLLALEGAIDNALEELETERLDKLRVEVRSEIQAQLEKEFGAEDAAEPERLDNLVEQEVKAFSVQWNTELRRLQTQHAPLQEHLESSGVNLSGFYSELEKARHSNEGRSAASTKTWQKAAYLGQEDHELDAEIKTQIKQAQRKLDVDRPARDRNGRLQEVGASGWKPKTQAATPADALKLKVEGAEEIIELEDRDTAAAAAGNDDASGNGDGWGDDGGGGFAKWTAEELREAYENEDAIRGAGAGVGALSAGQQLGIKRVSDESDSNSLREEAGAAKLMAGTVGRTGRKTVVRVRAIQAHSRRKRKAVKVAAKARRKKTKMGLGAGGGNSACDTETDTDGEDLMDEEDEEGGSGGGRGEFEYNSECDNKRAQLGEGEVGGAEIHMLKDALVGASLQVYFSIDGAAAGDSGSCGGTPAAVRRQIGERWWRQLCSSHQSGIWFQATVNGYDRQAVGASASGGSGSHRLTWADTGGGDGDRGASCAGGGASAAEAASANPLVEDPQLPVRLCLRDMICRELDAATLTKVVEMRNQRRQRRRQRRQTLAKLAGEERGAGGGGAEGTVDAAVDMSVDVSVGEINGSDDVIDLIDSDEEVAQGGSAKAESAKAESAKAEPAPGSEWWQDDGAGADEDVAGQNGAASGDGAKSSVPLPMVGGGSRLGVAGKRRKSWFEQQQQREQREKQRQQQREHWRQLRDRHHGHSSADKDCLHGGRNHLRGRGHKHRIELLVRPQRRCWDVRWDMGGKEADGGSGGGAGVAAAPAAKEHDVVYAMSARAVVNCKSYQARQEAKGREKAKAEATVVEIDAGGSSEGEVGGMGAAGTEESKKTESSKQNGEEGKTEGKQDEACGGEEEDEDEIIVHPHIGRALKPHQLEGLRYAWDSVVKNIHTLRQEDESEVCDKGCVLAHSMGLGKSLVAVALVHTLTRHPLAMAATDKKWNPRRKKKQGNGRAKTSRGSGRYACSIPGFDDRVHTSGGGGGGGRGGGGGGALDSSQDSECSASEDETMDDGGVLGIPGHAADAIGGVSAAEQVHHEAWNRGKSGKVLSRALNLTPCPHSMPSPRIALRMY
jgi:hypothetical protein